MSQNLALQSADTVLTVNLDMFSVYLFLSINVSREIWIQTYISLWSQYIIVAYLSWLS